MNMHLLLKTPQKLVIFYIVVILFNIDLSACKKVTPAIAMNYLKVVDASTVFGSQDFYLDNQLAVAGIPVGQSTNYAAVTVGTHLLQFKNSGSTVVNTSISPNMQGGFYTVFFTDDNSAILAMDDRSAPLPNDARVRFINLSSAETANVDISSTGAATAVIYGLVYKVPSPYFETSSNTFTVTASGAKTILLNINATLQTGHLYTIYLSGTSLSTITSTVIDDTAN